MNQENFTLSGEEYQLRRASEVDVVRIVELMADDVLRRAENAPSAAGSSRHLDAFLAIDRDPAQLLVVVDDAESTVVATMQLTIIPGLARNGATRLLVEAVRVDAKLRGNGLGTVMMQWAIAEGRRRGASLVQLTSDRTRENAHRFYERLGFEPSHVGFKLFL
ncbi:N-acetyltransferase family protein [Paeniglutamicibacter sp. R2-26]|uniref:GNAT family N-acetyltransferase n=1 Tax=Paeniglutamicibacter sp. R2-26 TaxID=3144417 RepID=UPI003EE5E470